MASWVKTGALASMDRARETRAGRVCLPGDHIAMIEAWTPVVIAAAALLLAVAKAIKAMCAIVKEIRLLKR
jgi:hypothetical protein